MIFKVVDFGIRNGFPFMRQSESENWSKVFFRVVIDRRAAKEREKFVCNFGFLGPFSVLVLVFFLPCEMVQ